MKRKQKSVAGKQKRKPVMRFRRALFWDVDPKTIDPEKHARYIIERVMEFGNDREVRWVSQYYTKRKIRDVVKRARGVMHQRSKNLWLLVFR